MSLFGFLACAAPPIGDTIGSNDANATGTKKTTAKKDTKTKTSSGDDDEEEDDSPTTGTKKRTPTPKTDENDFEDDFPSGPSGPTGPGGSGDQCFESCLTSSQAQQIDQQLMACGEQQCGQSQDEQCFMQCEQQICTGSKASICQQMFTCFEGCDSGGQQQGGFPQDGF